MDKAPRAVLSVDSPFTTGLVGSVMSTSHRPASRAATSTNCLPPETSSVTAPEEPMFKAELAGAELTRPPRVASTGLESRVVPALEVGVVALLR